jgi:lactam utilization protein B
MRWLKGVVMQIRDHIVLIELENGRKEWATPHFKLNLRETVLVAWDYTNDCIGIITTKERWESIETEQDKAEIEAVDIFPNPSDESFEGEPDDIEVPSNTVLNDETEENSISMVDVFRVPLNDEDVDIDSIVELRHDITL